MGKIGVGLSATHEKMTLTITERKQGIAANAVFPTKDASQLAGNVLETAKIAYEVTGKPPPRRTKGAPVSLTVVAPSGYAVGPGRKPTSTMMMFYFGETVLGIEVPNADARILGRRLMTAAAEGTAQ